MKFDIDFIIGWEHDKTIAYYIIMRKKLNFRHFTWEIISYLGLTRRWFTPVYTF